MDATLTLDHQVLSMESLTEELKDLFAKAGLDVEALDSLLDPRMRVVLGGWG